MPSKIQQPDGCAPASCDLSIAYEILLSPVYRVPVLHFTVRDSTGSPITDVNAIFSDIVPHSFQSQVANVGVIGGISLTVNALNMLFANLIDLTSRIIQLQDYRHSLFIHATPQTR